MRFLIPLIILVMWIIAFGYMYISYGNDLINSEDFWKGIEDAEHE